MTLTVEICSSVAPRYHQVYSVIIGVVNDNPALKQDHATSQSVGRSVDWSVSHTVSQSIIQTVN